MRTPLFLTIVACILLKVFKLNEAHVIDECSIGEKYWCSSQKNAKKCQKIEECFPSTKKNDYIVRKPIQDIPLAPDDTLFIKHNPYGGYIG